jgi:OOP family OmpA-OmpF porin
MDARNSTGINLDLVGILPLQNNFSLLGRIGVQNSETKGNASGTGAIVVPVSSSSKREFNYKVGLGAQYDFTKIIGARAEWERYHISDGFIGKSNVDIFSAGLVFRF